MLDNVYDWPAEEEKDTEREAPSAAGGRPPTPPREPQNPQPAARNAAAEPDPSQAPSTKRPEPTEHLLPLIGQASSSYVQTITPGT